jgi:hypothetical protein
MASSSQDASDFGRDFGYLMPFLAKLRTAAQALPPARRDALLALLEGEPARWERIRALLEGAEVGAQPPAPRPTSSGGRENAGLTVGGLKTHPRSR